jgi:hypothetical protein
MSKKAFDQIADGLQDALAIVRGAARPARLMIHGVDWMQDPELAAQFDALVAEFGFADALAIAEGR